MKTRFFKTNAESVRYDIICIKLDRYSLEHIKQGLTVRTAFYADNKEELPSYERECIVVEIGMNIDLNEKKSVWNERLSVDGHVDKNYLITSAQQIRKELVGMITEELSILGFEGPAQVKAIIPPEKELSESPRLLASDVEEEKEMSVIDKYLNLKQTATMLSISTATVLRLAREGVIAGKLNDVCPGWAFYKEDVEQIRNNKPYFLKKIWEKSSIKKKVVESQESDVLQIYVGIDMAKRILSLGQEEIMRHVKEGKLKAEFKEGINEWFFLKSDLESFIY